MKALVTWICLGFSVSLAGCGDVLFDEKARGPTLFTIQGQLVSDGAIQVGEELKVAVVWIDTNPEHTASVFTAQTVEVATYSFPATFTVNLTELPPPEMMHPWVEEDGTVSSSTVVDGYLVAFEDLDGDGTLAVPTLTNQELPDRVVAFSGWDLRLFYAEGPIPTSVIFVPGGDGSYDSLVPGFNLVELNREFAAAMAAILDAEDRCWLAGNDTSMCGDQMSEAYQTLAGTLPLFHRLEGGTTITLDIQAAPQAGTGLCPQGVQAWTAPVDGACPANYSDFGSSCSGNGCCVLDASVEANGSCVHDQQCRSGQCIDADGVYLHQCAAAGLSDFSGWQCAADGQSLRAIAKADDTQPGLCVSNAIDASVELTYDARYAEWWPCNLTP
jgi:hypothetical protein